ncbi:MAG TPA: hypothetical protein VL985_08685 [Stellaceae bacterium]|nr:hypothetical protein [Stellaceae bacterium]
MQHDLALAASALREARWLTRERLLRFGASLAFLAIGMLWIWLSNSGRA